MDCIYLLSFFRLIYNNKFIQKFIMYDFIIIGGGIVGLTTRVKILQSRPDL
jgi:hypothetical protein